VPEPFSLENVEKVLLTTTGNVDLPAISPDGLYVPYVQRDGDEESIWIRQIATASNSRIVEPRPGVRIGALTVTPDGAYVDYVTITQSPVEYTLWRVPFISGALVHGHELQPRELHRRARVHERTRAPGVTTDRSVEAAIGLNLDWFRYTDPSST